jgi:hypothetical protein
MRLSSVTTFEQVRAKAFSLLKPERFALVSAYLHDVEFDKVACEWAYYRTLSVTFKRNLRHLFANLQFAGSIEDAPLLEELVFSSQIVRLVRHCFFPGQPLVFLFTQPSACLFASAPQACEASVSITPIYGVLSGNCLWHGSC